MRIVFLGTPDYVVPVLDKLHKTFKSKSDESGVVAVVTQIPKPAGRKKELTYSAVDKWAHNKNSKVKGQNAKIKILHSSKELLERKILADVGILAAYGEIIPKSVIDHFPLGIINVHPSLLPEFRGASPVQAAIITGKKTTGVTFIKLDEKVDHGPIISQFKEEIKKSDTTDSLRKRLFEQSAEVLTTLLPAYLKGKIKAREQKHNKATFTTLVKKDHAFIPPQYLKVALAGGKIKDKWNIPFLKMKSSQASLIKNYSLDPNAYTLDLFIRSMQPWPVAWTHVQLNSKIKNQKSNLKRLKILKSHIKNQKSKIKNLVLDEVQLEGKNLVPWQQFKQGHPKAKL